MLVQFGNNWIQKIPLTANWTRPTASSNFGCPRNFFSSNYFQLYTNRNVSFHTVS